MVSDEEIVSGLQALLRQAPDFSDATLTGIVQHLGSTLSLDLSQKLPFIRHQIDLLLRSAPPKPSHQFHLHHPHHHPPPPAFSQHCQELEIPYETRPAAAPRFECPPKAHDFPQNGGEIPKPSGTKRRGGPGGLTKACGVSPELQVIVGQPAMPRTQIVKELWAYIRKNNLQDPSNKRKIICDDALRLVFETDVTDMFKMNKLLAKHILPLEPTKDMGPDSKRVKVEDSEVFATQCTEAGPSPPVMLSDRLANFIGTGENEMLPSEAAKRVWDYIKVNKLEDPLNSLEILCDTKLQELFGCERFSAFGISEMLACHFLKS